MDHLSTVPVVELVRELVSRLPTEIGGHPVSAAAIHFDPIADEASWYVDLKLKPDEPIL